MVELLKVFDDQKNHTGEATRDEVHQKGLWHETFQCLFLDENFVYFQLRSKEKTDFPDLLDITVGGHVKSHESMSDARREIQEELGIEYDDARLTFIDIIPEEITVESVDSEFIDKEYAHVHVYQVNDEELQNIQFTDGEVSDLVSFDKFQTMQLFNLELDELEGISVMNGEANMYALADFVPSSAEYYKRLANIIEGYL